MRFHRILWKAVCVFSLLWFAAGSAYAVNPDEVLDDPLLEERAREISAELRCLVCQNQNIDSSDAPLAKDLRVLVRERLVEGDSNEQVLDYVVSRYGEFALLKPKFGIHTLLLWGTPLIVLVGGLAFFVAKNRKNQLESEAIAELSNREKEEISKILGDNNT